MKDILVKYIRKGAKRSPIGKIIAVPRDSDDKGNAVHGWSVGWALCHKEDEYDPQIAKTICMKRALGKNPQDYNCEVPAEIANEVAIMFERAKRYFKGRNPVFTLNDLTQGQYAETSCDCSECGVTSVRADQHTLFTA